MTFEPVDWPDEYEAAHDRQDADDAPSPVARFKRYLAARKTARLGHRDTDTDETERLAVSTYRPIVPNEQLVHDVAQKVAVRALHDSVNVDQWITAVVNSAFGDSNGSLEERRAYHTAVARRMAVVKPSWPAGQPQDMCSCNEPRAVCELRTELDAANAECARATKRADLIDATLDAMRQQAIDAVKERNAANERAEKAEALARQQGEIIQRNTEASRSVIAKWEAWAVRAEAERDEARARLAEMRDGMTVAVELLDRFTAETACTEGGDTCREHGYARKPCPHPLGRQLVNAWRDVQAADATGTALSATETSELEFEASVPATKPEGAQRGAQGLCESERNDETGTER
jgi:hypothetical protein